MYKQLSLDDRYKIEEGLNNNISFRKIAKDINKHPSSISREIKSHIKFTNTGALGIPFNNCVNRIGCKEKKCSYCMKGCENYIVEQCLLLNKKPYVCNGCNKRKNCTLTKRFYSSNYAYQEYKDNLSEARSGVEISQEEINTLNEILEPLINNNNQSVHHALINNKNKIMRSEKTIYKYIDKGILLVRNIDLPRKVKFRKRKKEQESYKIDKKCRQNRTYNDYENYLVQNPDTVIVQMDSVEGTKGGKVLLTIHFVECSFMLAFLREHNDAQSVIDVFNILEEKLGLEMFKKLFPIILTDNGSEFSNPLEIEFSKTEEKRTQIFYCDASSPNQKGACEVNHEFIRRIIPKGESLNQYTQKDIDLMMSHINSYKRNKLNNLSPIKLFQTIYGKSIVDKLGLKEINPNEVILSSKLLKK